MIALLLAVQVAVEPIFPTTPATPIQPVPPPGAAPQPAPEEIAAEPVIPDGVRSMLDAAIGSNNEAEINTIARYARGAAPEAIPEIDGLVRAWRDRRLQAQQARLNEAGPLDLWKGQAELGGTRTTGISDTVGVSASFVLTREGRDWRHRLRARVDYQEAEGRVVRDAWLFGYEPRVQISQPLFVYGLAQYDSDSFLGFERRLSSSGGIGYQVLGDGPLRVDIDAGPTYRFTRFSTGNVDDRLGGRGSMAVRWQVAEGVRLTNDLAMVVDGSNNSFANTAALDAKLIGSLTARLSYNLRYEDLPQMGRTTSGTISRASLVYDF